MIRRRTTASIPARPASRKPSATFRLEPALVAALLATGLGAFGCHRTDPTANSGKAPPPHPADQLGSGEVTEGNEDAFGLALPAKLRIVKRERGLVVAEGSMSPEEASNYVRARTKGGNVEVGPDKTVFDQVMVLSPKKPFKGTLTIDLTGHDKFTSLQVFGNEFVDVPRKGPKGVAPETDESGSAAPSSAPPAQRNPDDD